MSQGQSSMTAELPTVTLPGGERVPALGQGTWHMGEDRRRAAEEATAVRLGIELGMTLIDTAETLEGFELLARDGKIRYHGVSNFDRGDMAEWVALRGGETVAADQVLYNLSHRGPEWDLVPWCHERGIAIMAYTPLGQGSMFGNRGLADIARR